MPFEKPAAPLDGEALGPRSGSMRLPPALKYLREMPNAELHALSAAALSELRARDQLAYATWSLEQIDAKFDMLCKHFGPAAMEAHRPAFRKFAIRKIASFLVTDHAFNTRVKRELRKWVKERAGTAAADEGDDDWRKYWESLPGVPRC